MVDPNTPTPCSHKQDGPAPVSADAPRIALAHDWVVAHRGGERVLAAIADALPANPVHLYTMFHNGTPISRRIDTCPTTVSDLNALPAALRRWLLPRYPRAVDQLSEHLAGHHDLNPIDLLVSTSSVAIKALRPPAGVPHLCYCHTPARYLWSQTEAYATPGLKGRLRAAGLRLFRKRLRRWDRDTADRVTAFLANSAYTRDLIRTVYDRDAEVLHPPVRTDFFTPDPSVPRDGSLLVVSALEPYKRVDLAIDAAARTGRALTVIGTGSHERVLRARARNRAGITFLGHASDDIVRAHMRRAHAFLMPQVEDFGITAVEAQACGTPVVALRAGGALDTVIDARTGVLADETTPESFAAALERLPNDPAAPCRENALRFSETGFRTRFLALLERHLRTR
ncbi:MAG: glycosyltransferase [Phycisphaerales bacterium]|nr:glycosyltransferase [Planctomycetota bacterium]MCH8508404.1 glycosyltransferase [Phycisphaerales bacterium]